MEGKNYPEIMLVDEVADYLRVNKQTIYNLLRRGELPAVKIGGQWRFSKKAIDNYLVGLLKNDANKEVAASQD